MAIAGGGRYRTLPLSQHATTNIETIQAFLDVAVHREGDTVIVERATPPA
jgi:RNA 3'-terminal phosphate cyclase